MNYLITALIGLIALAGSFFPRASVWDKISDNLGSISYPTSLDSLTNPASTDSVATVSHSGQHSNANDAIEALETKLGITSSTAVSNSFLVGNGAGSSIWSTYATGTQAYFTNFWATGSSTLQNFSFLGAVGVRATTTQATTTNLYAETASTTNFYGANLSPCSTGNFLTWTGGKFGCAADTTSTQSTAGYFKDTTGTAFKTIPVSANGVVLWWGMCRGSGGNTTLNMQYRWITDTSTTTVSSPIGVTAASSFSGFGFASATGTANTITVAAAQAGGNGCDQDLDMMTLLLDSE